MRGHAGQVDHRQVDDAGEPVVARVLVQVDGGQHADRRRDHEREPDQVERADEGRPDPAVGHAPPRHVEDELERRATARRARPDSRRSAAAAAPSPRPSRRRRPWRATAPAPCARRAASARSGRSSERAPGPRRLPPADPAHDDVGGQVDGEGDQEQQRPGQEQHAVVVGAGRRLAELGRDVGRQRADRVEQARAGCAPRGPSPSARPSSRPPRGRRRAAPPPAGRCARRAAARGRRAASASRRAPAPPRDTSRAPP